MASERSPIAVAATWGFGLAAAQVTWQMLRDGASGLDAVERGIRVAEEDPKVDTVGYGGLPNSEGEVELDAALMWGPGRRAGGVGGMQGIVEAISVARAVMEQTPHCLLVGDAARRFAMQHGFEPRRLLTPSVRACWEEWRKQHAPVDGHDTIGMVALDSNGDLCAGTSTSGIAFKLPGRVGDSPLVGGGLYVDNAAGAAAATGLGELILRHCASYAVVEAMRAGSSPEAACLRVAQRIVADDPANRTVRIGLIAVDRRGRTGAACTCGDFPHASSSNADVVMRSGPAAWPQPGAGTAE